MKLPASILIVTFQLPKFKGDIAGIYIPDYIRSLQPFASITLLYINPFAPFSSEIIFSQGTRVIAKNNYTSKKKFRFARFIPYLSIFIYVAKNLKKIKDVDIVYAQDSYFAGFAGWIISVFNSVPMAISIHDTKFARNPWKRLITAICLKRSKLIFAVSEYQKKNIAAVFPKITDKISIIYNPVDTELFTEKKQIESKTILYAGNIAENKGAWRCIKAFEKILPFHHDWNLVLIGNGPQANEIAEYLNSNHLLTKIKLLPAVGKPELAEWMKKSAFLVQPSISETFGLVLCEAMSTGLPVITCNTSGPSEFVTTNCGILIDPMNIDAIATAMRKIIEKQKQFQAVNIRKQVVNRFSFEVFGASIFKCLKEISEK